MDLPNQHDDEFDKDITGSTDPISGFADLENSQLDAVETFHGLWHTLQTMIQAGWSESQAIRFLAFCSIYEGD